MATLRIKKNFINWLTIIGLEELNTDEEKTPVYKFVFQGDEEKKKFEISLNDESDYKYSYSLFKLHEGIDLTLYFKGMGEYFIYDLNDVLIKRGKILIDNNEVVKSYSYPYPNKNNLIYS